MGDMTHKPTIINLFVKPERGQPMQATQQLEAVAGKGLQGDRTFGRPSRQVLLVDDSILKKFKLEPGALRENITVQHLTIDALEPGTKLAIGTSLLQITGPCDPCSKMDAIRAGLQSELKGQRGMLANVVQSGLIAIGDTISIQSA
jgi:MOSC domain-containing protein YiiM